MAPPSLIRLAFVALLAFAPTHSPAQTAPPAGVTQEASVEGVTEYRLANGLRVLLMPDASKPTTTVNITYLVGSRHENYGETGMAHLLEHLVFKGTPSFPGLFQELGRRGMRFNGTTFFDRTNYFETFSANDDNLDWALRMEAERMTQSTFSKADLDSEMTVVRNEFEMGENNPRRVLWKRLQALAFDWHNYGNVTIGARSDVENVDIDRLRAFYRDVLPAGQRGADRHRQVRAREDARADRQVLRRDSQAGARAAQAVYAGSGAGRRALGRRASRRVAEAHRHPLSHAVRCASGFGRDRGARRDHDDRAGRTAVPRARRDEEGDRGGNLDAGVARSRNDHLLGAGAGRGCRRARARRA